jgi:predicted kinase
VKVTILRGLPGSGKSTLAREIKAVEPYAVVVSANDYFLVDGEYRFDASKLPDAHNDCLRKYLVALEMCRRQLTIGGRMEVTTLLVDNTNLSAWEIAPYYRLAEVFGFEVSILTVHCSWEVAKARRIHPVPEQTFLGMCTRLLAETLPPWWKQTIHNAD